MTNDLIQEIESYLAATGVSASTFGREVMGNPSFVFNLRAGSDYTSKSAARVRVYMADNPPEAKTDAA